MSRKNLSGYVGHVTICSWMFTIACCLVVRLGLGLDWILCLVGKLLCTRICATLDCNCYTAEKDRQIRAIPGYIALCVPVACAACCSGEPTSSAPESADADFSPAAGTSSAVCSTSFSMGASSLSSRYDCCCCWWHTNNRIYSEHRHHHRKHVYVA